jgi:hypothetical protein
LPTHLSPLIEMLMKKNDGLSGSSSRISDLKILSSIEAIKLAEKHNG